MRCGALEREERAAGEGVKRSRVRAPRYGCFAKSSRTPFPPSRATGREKNPTREIQVDRAYISTENSRANQTIRLPSLSSLSAIIRPHPL